jgi:hypothetical protein
VPNQVKVRKRYLQFDYACVRGPALRKPLC